MLKLYPLFSGSSGNSTYIEFENKKGILVVGDGAQSITHYKKNFSLEEVQFIVTSPHKK